MPIISNVADVLDSTSMWSFRTMTELGDAAEALHVVNEDLRQCKDIITGNFTALEKVHALAAHRKIKEETYPKIRDYLMRQVPAEKRGIELHPDTSQMLEVCKTALSELHPDSSSPLADQKRRIFEEPFAELPDIHIASIERDALEKRLGIQSEMNLHEKYVNATLKKHLEIGDMLHEAKVALAVSLRAKTGASAPHVTAVYQKLLEQMLVTIRFSDAARLAPRTLISRHRFEEVAMQHEVRLQERAEAEARAESVARELLAAEECRETVPKKKTSRRVKKASTSKKPTIPSTTMVEHVAGVAKSAVPSVNYREHWQRYSDLANDPEASMQSWMAYLDSVADDKHVAGLVEQIQSDIMRTMMQDPKHNNIPYLRLWQELLQNHAGLTIEPADLLQSEIEQIQPAVLSLQEFMAYMKPQQRAAVFAQQIDALEAALKYGLSLPLNKARKSYFYDLKLQTIREPHGATHSLDLQTPIRDQFGEWCEFRVAADRNAIAMQRFALGEDENPEALPGLYTHYGSSVSLSLFARILQIAARDSGRVAQALVISSSRLLMHVREMEERGIEIPWRAGP